MPSATAFHVLPVAVASLLLRNLLQLHLPPPPPPPSPPSGTDPLAFLWPQPEQTRPTAVELSFVPGVLPRLRVASPGYMHARDGARRVQVDDSEVVALDGATPSQARGERITLELQGLAPGKHEARAWFEGPRGEREREVRLRFTLDAAYGPKPQPQAAATVSSYRSVSDL